MSAPRQIQRYGWRPDLPDPRDRIFNLEERIERGVNLPPTVDLASEMPPIYDQGQLGSCTANATAALLQHTQMRQAEAEGALTPSRLFIYYEERRLEGSPADQDTGAEVRTGIKVLVSEGAPSELDWPYDIARFSVKPSAVSYTHALRYEATAYKRIIVGGAGAPIRTALYGHLPIAFGFPVPASFEDDSWNPSSQALGLPGPNTQWIGGHAVVIVGYDFSLKRFPVPVFKVRNSWGAGWGEAGHFHLDYRWFDPYRQLASDLWIVQTVK